MSLFPTHTHWDIFCKVIDNFGDIGVCWRLASQLANEQQQHVRLWVDDLTSFQKICPDINPNLTTQKLFNVEICLWSKTWHPIEPADVVLEAFACNIPADYIEAMLKANKAIFWINLEYLTYEDWSVQYHTLPSLQSNGLEKYFFFTGRKDTGGLLREKSLQEHQLSFITKPANQQTFLEKLGVTRKPDNCLMLIFSYTHGNLTQWLNYLTKGEQTYHLLIPQTPLLADLANYLEVPSTQLTAGYTHRQGALTLQIIPFVKQEDFDTLLWCTDFNLIRGEDSFVRAQYAGQPMLWHIYPQQDDTHITKLESFLRYYLNQLSPPIQQAAQDLWLCWNKQQDITLCWQNYQKHLPELKKHAKIWAENQLTAEDLLTKLANFYKNWLS